MIVLCANGTSWDDRGLIPGGQGDRYLSPILEHLPQDAAVISRQPRQKSINAYMNHRGLYDATANRGERASVMISHGIADKTYRAGLHVKTYTHVVVPGPALAATVVASGVPPEKVHQLGYPKLDPVHRGEVASPWPERDGRVRVLWAPTHGGGSERHRRGNPSAPGAAATTWWHRTELLSLLDLDRFLVMMAPHPRHHPQHQATLAEYVGADVVLADGGSTMYEAWCVGLPVVFADWLTSQRNLSRARGATVEARVYREQIGRHATRAPEFAALVDEAAAAGQTAAEVAFAAEVLPVEYRGLGGKLHAELLLELEASGHTYSPHVRQYRPRRR